MSHLLHLHVPWAIAWAGCFLAAIAGGIVSYYGSKRRLNKYWRMYDYGIQEIARELGKSGQTEIQLRLDQQLFEANMALSIHRTLLEKAALLVDGTIKTQALLGPAVAELEHFLVEAKLVLNSKV